ncbi:hypothetical protein [Jeotgalibacillus soli]|uniref:Uncharacterized protein n=1 Tax=Jeotgalibacillus soli TaxID=889306 RepID=A0A0C2VP92_9BACL|nr:hypothetical protein [Jeotgalibacillus soli]KIL45828.1 hypothetical protein KP78_21770 [Jeotgalibacillus soli]
MIGGTLAAIFGLFAFVVDAIPGVIQFYLGYLLYKAADYAGSAKDGNREADLLTKETFG